MSSDSWRRVESIYHDALERGALEREAFLEEACAGDEALRHEVESLLRFDGAAGDFLERPALEEAVKGLAGKEGLLSAGSRIDEYEIVTLLGCGGMGDVHLARDTTLGREVALKVLPRSGAGGPDSRRRFKQEARLACALNHPNIVTIYRVGEAGGVDYIAMELVRGRTLRELLSGGTPDVAMALDLATQLADALAAAHEHGIVHRDLKPENVMVTPENRVKVLDFGIAKREGAAEPPPGARPRPDTSHTEAGRILGTVGYMSPEQAAGRPAERASDQFSFGAILYEMLSGRRAFERGTTTATLSAILEEDPGPVEGPAPLLEILGRCLAKAPGDRYEDTRELARALRQVRERTERRAVAAGLSRRRALWLGGTVAAGIAAGVAAWRLWPRQTGIRTLAVLPFSGAPGGEQADYLRDGMTIGLIRTISGAPGAMVRAWSAVSRFRGKTVDPREAGQRLGVGAVVAGTLALRKGQLRVTAELLDVATGARLWSDSYDRAAADLLAIQDEIASGVVDEGLRMPLSGEERQGLRKKPTGDSAAYDLYLRAIRLWDSETEADYLESRDLLRQALARDRGFALAYAALATTHSIMAVDGYERPVDAWPRVSENVRRALDWDPDLPDAHSEAASALFFFQWDWNGAEQAWNRALRSRGGGFVPDFLSSRALQRWAVGRTDEALRLVRQARELDPLSQTLIVREADFLLQSGRSDEAVRLYENVIGAEPGDPRAYFGLAEARREQGRFDEAIDTLRRGYAAAGDDALRDLFAAATGAEGYGRIEKATAALELDSLKGRAATGAYTSPLDFARAYARLGDREHVFDQLARAFDDRAPGLVFLNVDRAWDSVRDDPRFLMAVRRVGLPGA
jgi:TolB-like protein/predicted Ser/Thr protein kinase